MSDGSEEILKSHWLTNWKDRGLDVWTAWREVHTRFGVAAQAASELETGLIMLVSQNVSESEIEATEEFLEALKKSGELPAGPLAKKLRNFFFREPIPELFEQSELSDLFDEIDYAVKRRAYLIHHFYRDRSADFYTPEGCEILLRDLVGIHDDLQHATQRLRDTFCINQEAAWELANDSDEANKILERELLDAIVSSKVAFRDSRP